MTSRFDGTVDNRWRPDLESSQRRVREEEREAAEVRVFSRELSFVPARRRAFEPHDAQTTALIRRLRELEQLPHGGEVAQMLSHWRWMDQMRSPDEKQRFLERHIAAVRRDPVRNEHLLVFLMLVFEPVRRGVSKAFMSARSGLDPAVRDANWSNRAEARMIDRIERERLFDVTREAAIEAVFRYPSEPPDRFFPWLRETIAHRALDVLRAELPEIQTTQRTAEEAAAMQAALAGFEHADGPASRDRAGMRAWRERIDLRGVFEVVEAFFDNDAIREACRHAIGRLPRMQREVIDGYFFEEASVDQLAARRNVSESTIYNHKALAQKRMHHDDAFFAVLHRLGAVRDRARADAHARRCPDGRLPDGRRSVLIDDRAA